MEHPKVSRRVVRRAKGSRGRRPPLWPDLNFRTIAAAIGVSSTFLGRVMNGRLRPSIETAQKLAQHLGWTMEQVAALYSPEPKKFPYQKQEQVKDGKGIERTRGRTEKRAGGNPQTHARAAADRKNKLKPKRKTRPAAA